VESDGGTFRNANWLNIVNENPGNPGALTGANFDTGIANIGGTVLYTIGYNTVIANNTGPDLGIVSARFSSDTFELEVSTDGINFTGPIDFGPELAVDTGVGNSYFYGSGGGGLFDAELFVTPVDLDAFGIASGDTIAAVRVTAFPEGDLIRIAGLTSGPQITLRAAGRKVNGVDTVRLTWSGATSNQVDIYRCVQQLNGCDPALIATTGNDGRYIDSTGHTGQAGFRYKVCEAGTRTCSKAASVTFER
jgi:hypothetical protein